MQISLRKNVQHVTREEIAQASADFYSAQKSNSAPAVQEPASQKSRSYIERMRTKDLEQFFAKFGDTKSLYKFKDESGKDFVYVDCGKFKAYIQDFEFAVKYDKDAKVDSTFDFDALEQYCNTTDLPIEQAIADMIAFDLIGSIFPSYAESLQKHRDKKANDAFARLPKSVRMAMKTVNQKQLAENNSVGNKGRYGDFNVENHLKNTFGTDDK